MKKDPTDGAANLVVGKYYALQKGDWAKGMPSLSKGSDPAFKAASAADLTQPSEANKQVELADKWWDLSAKANGKAKSNLQNRAVYWYQLALPKVEDAFVKAKIEKRLPRVNVVANGTANKKREEKNGDKKAPESQTVEKAVFLDTLQEDSASVGYGTFAKGGATGYLRGSDPQHIFVRGRGVTNSLSMHPPANGAATAKWTLGKQYKTFSGAAGICDHGRRGTPLVFRIYSDGRAIWQSKPLTAGGSYENFSVNVSNTDLLVLEVNCPGPNEMREAVWLMPQLVKQDGEQPATDNNKAEPYIVAVWSHMGKIIQLYSNGTVSTGPGNTWAMQGNKLILRTPSPQAPGGVWVDNLTISPDGKTYAGTNNNGKYITGTLISGSMSLKKEN